MMRGIVDAISSIVIREYSFSLVFNEEPRWLQKHRQGIVLYRKHHQERIQPMLKQMLIHRSFVDNRIKSGVLR